MAIITLPDHGLSNSAARRCKHWMKILTEVNPKISNGYAFQGNFANYGSTVEVAEGTWVMGYREDRAASGRLYSHNVTLYQVRSGALVEVDEWAIDGGDRGWVLHVRDKIHAYMTAPAEPDIDALLAEREQLLARLAEIDALLPEPEGTEMSTREAAQALGVSVRTVQRWAAQGKVDATKDTGGRWVITIVINRTA